MKTFLIPDIFDLCTFAKYICPHKTSKKKYVLNHNILCAKMMLFAIKKFNACIISASHLLVSF